MGKEVTSLVNTEANERNGYYFSTLTDMVAFSATHQLAFRGKIDAFESNNQEGNELFKVCLITLVAQRQVSDCSPS